MSEIKDIQLLILSYDVFSRNTTWFTNNDSRAWYIENDIPLWQICTASASAPTFFPPYQLLVKPDEENYKKKYRPHIDGGVSANNPVLAAIAHAISMKDEGKQNKTKIDDIAVLSIGTGTTTRPYTYDEVNKWGQLGWVSHLPDMFLDPDAENSEHIALRMFRGIGRQKYLRLNFEINMYIK
ncbi:MAG: patatin-like phospholipase family protein [Moorea sp. SIO4G2]|nr:patatin-like phospholipase family protein [Moorena sp. SIO4G2]